MSDEVQAGQDPPTPSPAAQAGQDPPQQSPQSPAAPSRQYDQAYVDDLRREQAELRKAKQELDAIKKSQLSEQERAAQEAREAQDRATRAESRLRGLEIENHLLSKATDYGVSPGLIGLVLPKLDLAKLYNDSGDLDHDALSKAIKALVKEYPALALQAPQAPAPPSSNAGGTNPARNPNPPAAQRSWADVSSMSWGAALNESRNKPQG